MQLGQFPRDGCGPRPEFEREIGQGLGHPGRRLIEDERAWNAGEPVDAFPPRGAPRRQETLEEEPVGRQAGDAESRERRRGAGRRRDGEARGDRFGDEFVAGIGDQWGSRVGDERQRLALGHALQRAWPRFRGVVFVVRPKGGVDPVMSEKYPRKAGVLGQNSVRRGEHGERAQRHVAEIADRSGDDVEPRRQRRGRDRRAVDVKSAFGSAGSGSFRNQGFLHCRRRIPSLVLFLGSRARPRRHSQAQVKLPQFLWTAGVSSDQEGGCGGTSAEIARSPAGRC